MAIISKKYKLSSQKKSEGSGSRKLREHNERTSSSSSSSNAKTSQSSQYSDLRLVTEEEEAQMSAIPMTVSKERYVAQQQAIVKDTNEKMKNPFTSGGNSSVRILTEKEIEQQKTIPSPVRDIDAWKQSQNQSFESRAKAVNRETANASSVNNSTVDLRLKYIQETSQQATTPYIPGQPTTIEKLTAADKQEGRNAMNLGKFEDTASSYEEKVGTILKPLTGSKYPKVRFVGGALETIAYTPTAVPRLFTGLAKNPDATIRETLNGQGEQIINDPARGAGQLAGMAVLGKGLSKTGSAVKTKLPAVATGEQGILLKTKVVESPLDLKTSPKATNFAEYKNTVFGKDVFKTWEANTELVNIEPKAKGSSVLIGETKNGITDVYTRISKPQAEAIAKKYYSNTRNIKTPEGSFLEIEPTGKIDPAVFNKLDKRIETPNFKEIGTLKESNNLNIKNPFRIEKRVNLDKGILKFSDSKTLQLPEFTKTVTGNGKTVVEPLSLESGLVKKSRSLWNDNTATFKPPVEYATKERFIGEMPEMQTRFVNNKQFLTKFKEPSIKMDISDIQKLYNDAPKRGYDPIQTPKAVKKVSLDRSVKANRGISPFFASFPVNSINSRTESAQRELVWQKPPSFVQSPQNNVDAAIRQALSGSQSVPINNKAVTFPKSTSFIPDVSPKSKKIPKSMDTERLRKKNKTPNANIGRKLGLRNNQFGDINKILFREW